jgi:DNA polymerase-3 subunit epsilon
MGISLEEHHCALADARATGALATALLRRARQDGVQDLGELDCGTIDYPGIPWMAGRRGGRRQTRRQAHVRREASRAFLPRLVARLPGTTATGGATDEYLSLLDRVLEDRKVEPDEGRRLVEVATQWGLARGDVERAHRVDMDGLIQAAWADGVVTEAEATDLLGVGEMLGLNLVEVRGALSRRPASAPVSAARRSDLAGKRVCFTGELTGTLRGEPLTRAVAERVACEVGMFVQPGVTKKLDILVAADADSESGKARKAREYGKRVMAGPAFFAAVAVALDAG